MSQEECVVLDQFNDFRYDESLLKVRFIGPELETQSVPILELGNTLIAVGPIHQQPQTFLKLHTDLTIYI
jgi:hypothetical protein